MVTALYVQLRAITSQVMALVGHRRYKPRSTSVVSFLVLAPSPASLNAALTTVVRVDWLALALLLVATGMHFKRNA